MDAALSKQLQKLKRADLVLNTDLVTTSSGDSLALAFALTVENVEVVKWGCRYLNLYKVLGQILVFDFEEKKVIANFPSMVQHQDFSETPRSYEVHSAVFRKIYLDPDFEGNIFAEWVRHLEQACIRPSYKNYLKIRSMTLSPEAVTQVNENHGNASAYLSEVAQTFEILLTSKLGVPLIPYTGGQVVGAKMATRFANGDVYQLSLPEPDYVIDVLIREFKYLTKQTGASDQYVFGSFVTLTAMQPDIGKKYINSKFKNLNIIVLDKSENIKPDIWNSYQTSLTALLSKFTDQVYAQDAEALQKITETKDIVPQLQSFKEIVLKCM